MFDAAPAAVAEILAQRLVLHVVPAYTDAQAQASSGQHIHFGRLLGNQSGLSLAQNQHSSSHLNLVGHSGQVSEQNERLVEHVGVAVRAVPILPFAGIGPQDVIEDQQVLVTHGLGSLGKITNRNGVRANFGLREDSS